jgi:hypothetical protein
MRTKDDPLFRGRKRIRLADVRARVDVDLFDRITERVNQRSLTVSEYLRELIIADLQAPSRDSTFLLSAQTSIVSAFFLRRILNGLIGDAEAQRFEEAAMAKAKELIAAGESNI